MVPSANSSSRPLHSALLLLLAACQGSRLAPDGGNRSVPTRAPTFASRLALPLLQRSSLALADGFVCAVQTDGGVRCLAPGCDTHTPVAVGGVTNVVAVRMHYFHACALEASGRVACWRYPNKQARCDEGIRFEATVQPVCRAKALTVGAAVCEDGSVQGWAFHDRRSPLWTQFSQDRPVRQIVREGSSICVLFDKDGAVSCIREPSHPEDSAPDEKIMAGLSGLSRLDPPSPYRICGSAEDGSYRCANLVDTQVPVLPPLPAGGLDRLVQRPIQWSNLGCYLTRSHQAWCWNDFGQPEARQRQFGIRVDPVRVELADVREIDMDYANLACARTADSDVFCWGATVARTAAVVKVEPNPVDPLVHVALGPVHQCGVRRSGKLVCWGDSTYGQAAKDTLYSDIPSERSDLPEPALRVFTDADTTCVVGRSLEVYCFGGSDRPDRYGPVPVRIDNAKGAVLTASQCALIDNGTVRCWAGGRGARKAEDASRFEARALPGLSDVAELRASHDRYCARRRSGDVLCWGLGAEDDDKAKLWSAPRRVHLMAPALLLRDGIGLWQWCAVVSNGNVECWNGPAYGVRDSDADDQSSPRPPVHKTLPWRARVHVPGLTNDCVLTADDRVGCSTWAHGTPPSGSHHTLTGLEDIAELQGSFDYQCARRRDGEVFCWDIMMVPQSVPELRGARLIDGSACGQSADGTVVCFGRWAGSPRRPMRVPL